MGRVFSHLMEFGQSRGIGFDLVHAELRIATEWVPGIAMRDRAPDGRHAFPADPDRRMRVLDRPRLQVDVIKLEELAVISWVWIRPSGLHHIDIFVGDPAAGIEIRQVERFKLFTHPTRTAADRHPSPG